MLNQPFTIPAILFLILSLPLILGLIQRQWAIGIRTPKTLSDDDIWVQANRFGGVGYSNLQPGLSCGSRDSAMHRAVRDKL